jgi:hypothetical protein
VSGLRRDYTSVEGHGLGCNNIFHASLFILLMEQRWVNAPRTNFNKIPSDKLQIRARDISQDQVNKLEELWKTEPDARFIDLDRPDAIDETELSPTLLHYEDVYHYVVAEMLLK